MNKSLFSEIDEALQFRCHKTDETKKIISLKTFVKEN